MPKNRLTLNSDVTSAFGKIFISDPIPLKIKPKTATVKYVKLKKKAQKLKISKVIKLESNGRGKLSNKLASANNVQKSFKKHFKVKKVTGKVAIKKGLRKGMYKITVKAKAAGNDAYAPSSWKTVTFKVKVK